MASSLRFFFEPNNLPPAARESQEACQNHFRADPNVTGALIAWNDNGAVGYGFLRAKQVSNNMTYSGIKAARVDQITPP
jgi:hypothetical protein